MRIYIYILIRIYIERERGDENLIIYIIPQLFDWCIDQWKRRNVYPMLSNLLPMDGLHATPPQSYSLTRFDK